MNPWKTVPASEYDGHMNHPAVDQQRFLADFFEETLRETNSRSVLLAGCATGNGLERVVNRPNVSVTAMDINRAFLEQVQGKFSTASNISTCEGSVEEAIPGSYDLIFAGLILEYVHVPTVFKQFISAINERGTLAVVIQLHSPIHTSITPTGFESLGRIDPIMNHLDPDEVVRYAHEVGLQAVFEKTVTLASGKKFVLFRFQ